MTNFYDHTQRVERSLARYPDFRALDAVQRAKLLDAIAKRGAFHISAASIADAIEAMSTND